MKFLLELQRKQAKLFEKNAPLERFHPLFEAGDTFLFSTDARAAGPTHVRDGLDLKRMMITVVVALAPIMLMAMYNTGYQANLAISQGATALQTWQSAAIMGFGVGFDPGNILACFLHGALYFLPVYLVTVAVGGAWEALFAIVRRHEINEGFLVTSALFPLILPATIPLWQVAFGISFGVVIAKEIFGGVGMNIFNPALMARAFLFFAYPAAISGDRVWIAADFTSVDGLTGATLLARAAEDGMPAVLESSNWMDAFLGFIPGSMGETSTLLCLFGAAVLIATGVGSWRTMLGVLLGCTGMSILLNVAPSENPFFKVPFYWHYVLGGFAFGAVFMATDPVSSAFTNVGKWIYGLLIGVMGILVRVINPAFPEGWMLAILFMNMFAPFIDHWVVQANIKRRMARNAA